MTLESKLKEIKDRADNATAGPWEYSVGNCGSIFGDLNNPEHNGDNPYIGTVFAVGIVKEGIYKGRNRTEGIPDAEFITHARTDIPMLLEMFEKLQQRYLDLSDLGAESHQEATYKELEKTAEKYK